MSRSQHTMVKLPLGISRLCLLLLSILLLASYGCAIRSDTKIPTKAVSGKAVSQTALCHIGVPYVSGGASPHTGFDCSGLVTWTYKQHGITVPRTAQEQMRAGQHVAVPDLRAGDLVVFKISRQQGYHSGIYTGKGQFVHSPRKGKTVRQDHIRSKYWYPRLAATRRLAHQP